ncbi:MAG: hypothetical protein FJ319_01250 [SAR202 cluster bacterium]|nr:hypothetical protein [SAR202 cluster bacterium]
MGRTYVETFDNGPGGWATYERHTVLRALEHRNGVVTNRSPFMLDSNHAYPGGGYFLIVAFLMTLPSPGFDSEIEAVAGTNAFLEGGYPADFTNARVTVRLKGEGDTKGARLVLHTAAEVGDLIVPAQLVGQPIEITRTWSEQTVTMAPEQSQWNMMGGNWSKGKRYRFGTINEVLPQVKNLIFVLSDIDVVPAAPMKVDSAKITFGEPAQIPPGLEPRYILRAGRDYPVDWTLLPSGSIAIDTVKIEFP